MCVFEVGVDVNSGLNWLKRMTKGAQWGQKYQ